jgi:hypothetical protein
MFETYQYPDGKRVSNHPMRDCSTFVKLQESMELSQTAKSRSTTYSAPPPLPYNKGAVNQGYQNTKRARLYPIKDIHLRNDSAS